MMDSREAKATLVPVALVRYRFDALANIPLHFHDLGERSAFFFPAELPHRDGQWIFVEFAVEGSEVPCLARGRVRAPPSNSTVVGSWLEFPTPDLPAIIRNLAQIRREHERLPIDVTASVRCADGAKLVCRIADVSADGLRLSGLPFFLNVGEDVSIEMVGERGHSNLGKGLVVWVRGQESGIYFEQGGSGNQSLVMLVEQAVAVRSSAIEFAHPDSCSCRHGQRPFEPPLPGAMGGH